MRLIAHGGAGSEPEDPVERKAVLDEAVTAGAGEDIARVTLSRMAVERLEVGDSPQKADEHTIERFEELTDSTAGIIVLGSEGRAGSAYNSAAMQTSIEP